MDNPFQVTGNNSKALFTLKIHRGDGMALLAMNWKKGRPPKDFIGFAIEFKQPGGKRFFILKNRLSFPNNDGSINRNLLSSLVSPIQKFRWVHFPRNAEMEGLFTYRVTPVFMDDDNILSYGDCQHASIVLARETYPGQLNVTFTRGFVSSQAFIDRYQEKGKIETLLPPNAHDGPLFKPTHPEAKKALAWMGFEARNAIIEVLDLAIADKSAKVRVIAYDLSESVFIEKLEKLKGRLKIIIDNDGPHNNPPSGEAQAEMRLRKSAGNGNVIRHHMGKLQHNKTIVVDGKVQRVVCGSTNFSWRGFFVQANNALIFQGASPVQVFLTAFENYWESGGSVSDFGETLSAKWNNLNLEGISAQVSFSPHTASNALLQEISNDVERNTTSSLFYSLAFLFQTRGLLRKAIKNISANKKIFVYGISDKEVGELELQKPDGNISPVFPANLIKTNTPEPFKSEIAGGRGNRLHHKFLVIDFDKPTARVYVGSYNFSIAADITNGENLLIIKDRRIAVSYMIEAIRLFDHYHFRVAQKEASNKRKTLSLALPPRVPDDKPWWLDDYTNPRRARDRKLFS